MAATHEVSMNGWTAVPIDAGQLFNGHAYRNAPKPLRVADIEFPCDPIVAKVQDYAKEKLPEQTYMHSMRVYYFATIIMKEQFPEHATSLSTSTLALTCLLHDIGTAEENQSATRMSFEFYGGFKALNLLVDLGCSKDQAEAVCETIIRHQDLGTDGNITLLGQVIQLATIYDNVSDHPHVANIKDIIHRDSRKDVIKSFPRNGWLGCFARTVQEELRLKPWSHTSHIPDFDKKILGNKLMQEYE